MAFFDNTTNGPGLLSSAQAITTTAASTQLYDVTGAGSGVAPSITFGNGPVGFDIAGALEGIARPVAYFVITTLGTGAGTITFQVQAAPNSSNSPGTYVVVGSSDAYVGTTLLKGNVIAIPITPYNQIAPSMSVPRFYRANYVVSGSATASVTAFIGINLPTGYEITQYGNNYTAP